MKRKNTGIYKQQYSPYGSPNPNGHGSPGYLPNRTNTNSTSAAGGGFNSTTPPRPPSGSSGNSVGGSNTGGATLQINQAQQLHISQQSHGHGIQVSNPLFDFNQYINKFTYLRTTIVKTKDLLSSYDFSPFRTYLFILYLFFMLIMLLLLEQVLTVANPKLVPKHNATISK